MRRRSRFERFEQSEWRVGQSGLSKGEFQTRAARQHRLALIRIAYLEDQRVVEYENQDAQSDHVRVLPNASG